MKKIVKNALYFSLFFMIIAIFLSIGASNILSSFLIQKMSSKSITLSIMDMVYITAQISFVLSVVLLLVKKTKYAFFIGLLAIILSALNMVVGSLIVKKFSNDYITIISSVIIGSILYCIFLYVNKKRNNVVMDTIKK